LRKSGGTGTLLGESKSNRNVAFLEKSRVAGTLLGRISSDRDITWGNQEAVPGTLQIRSGDGNILYLGETKSNRDV
jgi:hypothetical protein